MIYKITSNDSDVRYFDFTDFSFAEVKNDPIDGSLKQLDLWFTNGELLSFNVNDYQLTSLQAMLSLMDTGSSAL